MKVKEEFSLLHIAIKRGDLREVEKLIEAGVDVNQKTKLNQKTPLILSIYCGDIRITKILIESGAKINAVDEWGNTALHTAVYNNDVGLVQTLIYYKAEVEKRNRFGSTPMHYAADSGSKIMCDILLNAGAILYVLDNDGCLPYQRASLWPKLEEYLKGKMEQI